MTMQMPNLAPAETKRITVCLPNYCVVYSYRASDHSKSNGIEILTLPKAPPPPAKKGNCKIGHGSITSERLSFDLSMVGGGDSVIVGKTQ